jgi:hypothetical protein
MTFASKLNEETPQSIWEEQQGLGGRMLLTIPFGSDTDDMQGFVSTVGREGFEPAPFPVLTFCIAKPTGGAIVSTVVFPTADLFLEFVDKLHCDAYAAFERQTALIEN